ncbi:MAG TPA: pitrilysin family protein [Phycisphaerae bacterium]|nr:pitrilysin family protein [Phycisphaerae bacterium]
MHGRPLRAVVASLLLAAATSLLPQTARAADEKLGITWTQYNLPNGLQVILVPMPTSPVTHVRVLYHVGSKDERPDRQGFAHMFEHMMFRGSAHVAPQEHMKLINGVGGYSNASTAFDVTQYVDTVPANFTQLALWLEADRMSSFKVSAPIFQTERLVVNGEWRNGRNRPYGTMWEDLFAEAYKDSPYKWTPIGNMDQLAQAKVGELQAFFNHYYVPNNAILVVAGNINVEETKAQIEKYFAWIPSRGGVEKNGVTEPGLAKNIPQEPPQTQPRSVTVTMKVALPRVVLVYHMPKPTDPDFDAANMMMEILGDGRSSRLSRALVTNDNPLCVDAEELSEGLEDGGIMGGFATVLQGKDPQDVEKVMREQMKLLRDTAVSPDELEKAKQEERLALATRFETAEKVTDELGNTQLIYGNLDRVKTARARIEAITPADIQRVAKRFLNDDQSNLLTIVPGNPTPQQSATEPLAAASQAATQAVGEPPTAEAKPVDFPRDYPTTPPMGDTLPSATFAKGVESTIDGVHVIVMEDHRQPTIEWTLTTRMGSFADPQGKEGLADMTDEMVRRGPKGKTFDQFNTELDNRGITLEISDGGDNTQISGFCLTEEFPTAIAQTRSMLLNPAFDPGEFTRVKNQDVDSLRNALLTDPTTLAARALTKALYGDSVLGRLQTPKSLEALSLDDIKNFYKQLYTGRDAVLMIAGDISVPDGQKAAAQLLEGFSQNSLPPVAYELPAPATTPQIILVDDPDAKQSVIRLGERAYDLHNDIKFAGSLASEILSSGIESRLGTYVRAQKGYSYDVQGRFSPSREAGAFIGSAAPRFETTADTVTAMLHVFEGMQSQQVPDKELAAAKFEMAGSMLMGKQTVSDQAAQRLTGILNGYPADYYDKYAARVGEVTAQQIQNVMQTYVNPDHLITVVVAPAAKVKDQLQKLGPVTILPMSQVGPQ